MNQKAEDLLNAGNLHLYHGEHDAARRLFDYAAVEAGDDSQTSWDAVKCKAVSKLAKGEDLTWVERVLRNHTERYPTDFVANLNLSVLLGNKFKFNDSVMYAESAIESITNEPPELIANAYVRLAHAYHCVGQHDDAVKCHEKALEVVPAASNAQYKMWLGMDQMTMGDWKNGLKNYAARERGLIYRPKIMSRVDLKKGEFGGYTGNDSICLSTEQGAGDVIMGMRAARKLKAQGARKVGVLIAPNQDFIADVLRYCDGVDDIFYHENEELAIAHGYASYIPVLSTIEGPSMSCSPYIKLPQSLIDMKREFRGEVGICWRGNPIPAMDYLRRMDMTCILKMAGHTNPALVQYKVSDAERCPYDGLSMFPDASFIEQAAVIANLRLLVTVDTAAGHLAGAMGVPCIVLVSAFSDWRWGLPGKVEPVWYDSVRVVRQTKCGTWEGDIERVKEIIDKELAKC